jgi:hypothetical protein
MTQAGCRAFSLKIEGDDKRKKALKKALLSIYYKLFDLQDTFGDRLAYGSLSG